jgi:hypothetical protein
VYVSPSLCGVGVEVGAVTEQMNRGSRSWSRGGGEEERGREPRCGCVAHVAAAEGCGERSTAHASLSSATLLLAPG